jgi:magnesium-transporting ATPase (P-type)
MSLKEGRVMVNIPHNSESKRAITAIKLPEDPSTVRVVVKGAPEDLIKKCSRTFSTENKLTILSDDE